MVNSPTLTLPQPPGPDQSILARWVRGAIVLAVLALAALLAVVMCQNWRSAEEALANARKARETLGDETIQKIAAAMHKKQQSATEQAKAKIAVSDADRVAAEILWMLEDKSKK